METPEPATQKPSARLDCIDLLRGLVIVIMALDHVKGNIAHQPFDFVDLTQTTPQFFLTRWITHCCAPVFVFLAGTGAYLYGSRGRSKGELSWFLISRGVWLIFLELTVIRFSWYLNVNYLNSFGQVIWAIGWSMIVLAALVHLPVWAITTFGVGMIALHNLTDGVRASDWGQFRWIWVVLHTGEHLEPWSGANFHPFYPLIPWIGVMAAGYGFGSLMLLDREVRRTIVLRLGIALCVAFILLRYANVYGDRPTYDDPEIRNVLEGRPGPWSQYEDWHKTMFSFVNCQKYPPSLLFLLMTLGPALVFMALVDRDATGPVGRFFVVFGRVPLFFYLLHWYLIKAIALGLAYHRYGHADWMFDHRIPGPPKYGYELWVVYIVWFSVVALLFPLCVWFARVKARSRSAWLSYL